MKQLLFKVEETDDCFTATCHEPEMTAQAGSMEELIQVLRRLIDVRIGPEMKHPRFDM
jgi:hypothetical protein